jgi:hypothetical protein
MIHVDEVHSGPELMTLAETGCGRGRVRVREWVIHTQLHRTSADEVEVGAKQGGCIERPARTEARVGAQEGGGVTGTFAGVGHGPCTLSGVLEARDMGALERRITRGARGASVVQAHNSMELTHADVPAVLPEYHRE